MSKVKVSEWLSEWQGHLLSCCGQLKTAHHIYEWGNWEKTARHIGLRQRDSKSTAIKGLPQLGLSKWERKKKLFWPVKTVSKKWIWIYSDIHSCNFVDTNIFGHSFVSKFSRMSHSALDPGGACLVREEGAPGASLEAAAKWLRLRTSVGTCAVEKMCVNF